MMLFDKIITYLKAGYLLHTITVVEVIAFSCFFYFVDVPAWLSSDYIVLKLFALSPIVGMPLFAQLDARSRFQNYKLIKDRLYLYGFQTRILKPFVKSRCQRDAARAAANELGMDRQCLRFFDSFGYRWYHLFPDAVFKKPSILATKNFWITTLFTKKYVSRIDFNRHNRPPSLDKSTLFYAET
jgi:hypothetical protein